LQEKHFAARYAEIKYKKGDKQMKNKMKFGLLLLTVAALVLVPLASAYPTYVPSKAASCSVCHVNPNGGGTLTPAGSTFKSTGKLPVATPPPVVTPPKVTPPVVTPPVVTPPVVTPPVVTTPTPPATPTAPTIVDEENDHHDDDHHGDQLDEEHNDGNHHNGHKEHKEEHEQEEEHDED